MIFDNSLILEGNLVLNYEQNNIQAKAFCIEFYIISDKLMTCTAEKRNQKMLLILTAGPSGPVSPGAPSSPGIPCTQTNILIFRYIFF